MVYKELKFFLVHFCVRIIFHLTAHFLSFISSVFHLDFYENEQSSQETLQCPRCSASVLVNPGVCGNCSENVFQCHKCRAINYDEKDAFLCNSCGFSKFGKFDYVVCAKLSSSVDKINNEQERTQTVNSTTNLLEKADQVLTKWCFILNYSWLELMSVINTTLNCMYFLFRVSESCQFLH